VLFYLAKCQKNQDIDETLPANLVKFLQCLTLGMGCALSLYCCFADMWQKARYFFEVFGTNEDALILIDESDENGDPKLYEAAALTFWGERRFICHIKAERKDGKIAMSGATIKKQTETSKRKPRE